ncbi:hypothetical protein B9Z19DRAFT_1105765 [Tuber borchii]|uniref:Uncharacterized protein n=1 Tax=Tuber borchii TaxID=42251 RepID=A0A2T7A3Y6_TUBBO|nr:hypothetical protein B9Z19DRAFT_1105765 [Tuber borchii]
MRAPSMLCATRIYPGIRTLHMAVIKCQVPRNKNKKVEKKSAVRVLRAASDKVEKKSIGNKEYAYVNQEGGTLLEEIRRLSIMLQPLEGTAIAIRQRFFNGYCLMVGKKPPEEASTSTLDGHKAAYNGNIITDSHMIANGDLEDTSTFYDLYGIPQETAGRYFQSQKLIKMFNKRATVIANPTYHITKWNEHYQTDFNTILAFFENADPKGLASFEAGIRDTQLPATLTFLASLALDRITAIERFLTKPKRVPAKVNPIPGEPNFVSGKPNPVPGEPNPVPGEPKPESK